MKARKNQKTAEVNSYYQNFLIAQINLNELIQEERLLRKLRKRDKQKIAPVVNRI